MTTWARLPYVTNRKRKPDTVTINTNRETEAHATSGGSDANTREV
ncbi:MAG: hypothetical protein QOK46_1002 [Microbacteriaceae bacterium]|nr:hypothetical protein [Microbacteriaceae bacterium]MDQ1553924.1 hypothetical protein [Microbacteriaceae bacterium]